MPFIGARVNGYTISTEALYIDSCLYDVRVVAASRITKRGDFIYINGEVGQSCKF